MGRPLRGAAAAQGLLRPRRRRLHAPALVVQVGSVRRVRRAGPPHVPERLRPQGRVRHAALHAARARPERRGRLGRAARSRLRRVLRLRRVHVRLAQLEPVRRSPLVDLRDPDRGRGDRDPRLPRRPAVTAVIRRLPRDRDVVLPPGLPRARDQRQLPPRDQLHERLERDRRARSRSTSSATTCRSRTGASSTSGTSTSRSRSSSSSWSRFASSTTRARGVRGARCARTRSRPS